MSCFTHKSRRKMLAYALLIVFLSNMLALSGGIVFVEASSISLGQVLFEEQRSIAGNAMLKSYIANHPAQGIQRGYTMDIQPASDVKLISAIGDKLYSRFTLTQFAKMYTNESQRVIGGINGDFYDTKTGVPIGPVIRNGRIVTSSNDDYPAVGFYEDGRAYIGNISFRFKAEINNGGDTIYPTFINKNLGQWGIYVFDESFAESTKAAQKSYDVVLEKIEGEFSFGSPLKARVVEIIDDAVSTGISAGRIILSAEKCDYSVPYIEQLKKLKLGDELLITSEAVGEGSENWLSIKEAIGGGQIILNNGEIATKDNNVHPRTAIGVKQDGSTVIFTVDGRQPEHSVGMNLIDIAAFFMENGCTSALNLDGGGSTTISARMPGSTDALVLNKPSDGRERANPNALLLVTPVYETGTLSYLHNYPRKAVVLAGAQLAIDVKGTDSNFQPVQLNEVVSWETTNGIGKASNGVLTAGKEAAAGVVISRAGDISGISEIEVVREVQFNINKTALYLEPGKTFDFNISAVKDMLPVVSQDNVFRWTIKGDIGAIDNNGLFKASAKSDLSGMIYVSYDDNQIAACYVSVGKLPVVVESFEAGIEGWNVKGDRLPDNGDLINLETSEDFVRFGKQSMRLDYNMVGGASGTAGVYADKSIPISGYPTHIGMWVYGDGNGHWLRAQMRDGSNNSFNIDFTNQTTGVDWVGWRYVEAAVPAGRPMPLSIDRAVRYMQSSDSKKTAGTIYIDNIRAVYGFRNDDISLPRIDKIFPVENSVLKANSVIRIKVSDNKEKTDTGIDINKTRLYINGIETKAFTYSKALGTIQIRTSGLADGKHRLILKLRDNYGNESVKSWDYSLDTGSASLYTATSDSETLRAGQQFIYAIKVKNGHKGISKLNMSLIYDSNKLEIVDMNLGLGVTRAFNTENSETKNTIRIRANYISSIIKTDTVMYVVFKVKEKAQGATDIAVANCYIDGKSSYLPSLMLNIK